MDTIELIKAARQRMLDDPELKRAWTQATGLVATPLEAPAKILTTTGETLFTPLRNMIPRVAGRGGTAETWRAITAINTGKLAAGVEEGKRGGVQSVTLANYTASYKGLGLEDSVSFEADYAAEGFDDAKAQATSLLLKALMAEEEATLFGGNLSISLGTPVTPTVSDAASTGGSVTANTTIYVYVVAMTNDGYRYNGGVITGTPLLGSTTRTNAGISSTTAHGGYNGQVSAVGNVTTANDGVNTHVVHAYTTAIAGAVAYAWFWGSASGAANATIGAITTINSVAITTDAGTGTMAANNANIAADYSVNATIFDGLISLICGAGPEVGGAAPAGYRVAQDTGTPGTGTALTADAAGGILEVNTDLAAIYAASKMSPSHIFMGAAVLDDFSKKVVAGGGASMVRFNYDGKAMGQAVANGLIVAGSVVGFYLNKFVVGGPQLIPIVLHPNCPPGMIMYYTEKPTIALPNIRNLLQVRTRKEYYQLEWPLLQRVYEYGVYVDEMLQIYYPAAFGMRYNIGT